MSQAHITLEGRGEAAGGRSTFHINSQPRKLTFPKALVTGGDRDGHEEVLPPCGHFQ